MVFGIEKSTVYNITCGDIDLSHITVVNNGGSSYSVYSYDEEIDVFNYRGDKPFDAIHEYLEAYAVNNGYA